MSALNLQAKWLELPHGKTMADVVGQAVQLWFLRATAGSGLTVPIVLVVAAGVLVPIATAIVTLARQH